MKFVVFILLFSSSLWSQIEYPKDYFRSPLSIPLELSGNFGELRANHFHSGFDIKTQKTEGLPVFASADGYVSRIKISAFGYGKAIYITHPNGFTTVYGHLQKANGAIEKCIKENQYKEKSYEIEIFPKPTDLPVKKSEIIAFSGNTGGSGGPHLHFEFRDTKTEKIINPMFFGFDTFFKDTHPPTINGLYLYPLNEKSVVNRSNSPISVHIAHQKDGTYLAEKVTGFGKLGFGINTFDQFDLGYNKYGVYKVAVFNNGKSVFSYAFDTFAFEEFRYVNALIDYARYEKINQRVQKLFMKNIFPLSIIKTDESNGVITLDTPNITQHFRIEISDFMNNKTVISIPIEYSSQLANNVQKPIQSKYFVNHKRENLFAKDNVEVLFPPDVFYDDFFMDFEVKNDTIFIHNSSIPVHSNFSISIDDKKHPETELNRFFIGKMEQNKITYISTYRNGTVFKAKTKELGNFSLIKDTIAPKISITKPIEGKWISDKKNIQLLVSDELSGIKEYHGYLNGKWILFEYEYKTKTLTHNFEDGIVAEGKNDLKVVVTDNVGNSSIFETSFFRSQK